MRTSDEILKDAKNDIITTGVGVPKRLWIEYRKLEVLIDIRDLHAEILYSLKTYILHERGKD